MTSRPRCLPPAIWKRCSRSPARPRWTCGPGAGSSRIFMRGTRSSTAGKPCCAGFRNKNLKRRGHRMAVSDVTTFRAEQSGEATNTNGCENADSTSAINGGQVGDNALADLIDYLDACCADSTGAYL